MRFIRGHNIRGLCGASHSQFRHGGQGTSEYNTYRAAKGRCTNPRNREWPDYGGRGIRFLFARFEDFVACLGPRPAGLTLDRINNDSHYMPGNCRWATWKEQQNNRRPAKRSSAVQERPAG